jgi:hypothetical protein
MAEHRPSRKKQSLFLVSLVFLSYLGLEIAASAYGWFTWWDHSFLLFDDVQGMLEFDPICGYRVGSSPARMARITDGRVEYVGILRGNTLGFASRHNFAPKRPAGVGLRLAVFGDSFTHAPHLSQNWPDHAEDLLCAEPELTEFLNFAQWGAGLANWWSILAKLIEAQEYALDGVIFAISEGNLRRGFTVFVSPAGGAARRSPLFGRCPSWDPRSFPANSTEADQFLEKEEHYFMVSRGELERALQGEWPKSVEWHFRPMILTKVYRGLRGLGSRSTDQPVRIDAAEDRARNKLVADIRRYLDRRGLPALVVYIPSRATLLRSGGTSALHLAEAKQFADDLRARFLDGSAIYEGMDAREIMAHFYPQDGHWNQKGSDRFAHLILKNLAVFKPPSLGRSGRR